MTHPAAGDGSIELARGRRAPYTQVGDWVALADVSRAAKALYWLLAAHVNPQRDDGGVWPSRRALAEALGYAKVESVDPLVKELAKLGAVDVLRRRHANGAPAPNRYVVHETPPAGYPGPASLAEFYDRRRRPTSQLGGSPLYGGTPVSGGTVPRSTGGGVPPYTGHELDQEELHQEEPPPPTPSTPPPAAVGGREEVVVAVGDAVEGPRPGNHQDAANGEANPPPAAGPWARGQAADVDAEALAVVVDASWPVGARPGVIERHRLARAVRPCLDRGHRPAELQQAMTGNLDGARNPVAVAVTRLRELAAADPQPEAIAGSAAAAGQVEPHPYVEGTAPGRCGTCGRHEAATAGGRRLHPLAAVSTTTCTHGRHPFGCPQCRATRTATTKSDAGPANPVRD